MAKQTSRGWGLAGLIISIISLLLCWFPFLGFLLAAIAIVCAIVQITKNSCAVDVFTIVLAIIVIFINLFFITLAWIFGFTLFSLLILFIPFVS